MLFSISQQDHKWDCERAVKYRRTTACDPYGNNALWVGCVNCKINVLCKWYCLRITLCLQHWYESLLYLQRWLYILLYVLVLAKLQTALVNPTLGNPKPLQSGIFQDRFPFLSPYAILINRQFDIQHKLPWNQQCQIKEGRLYYDYINNIVFKNRLVNAVTSKV